VLACELVAAVRAAAARHPPGRGRPLAEALDLAASELSADTADRSLDGDLAAAQALLPQLAGFVAVP
jgi:histidine ammonia-lyase